VIPFCFVGLLPVTPHRLLGHEGGVEQIGHDLRQRIVSTLVTELLRVLHDVEQRGVEGFDDLFRSRLGAGDRGRVDSRVVGFGSRARCPDEQRENGRDPRDDRRESRRKPVLS